MVWLSIKALISFIRSSTMPEPMSCLYDDTHERVCADLPFVNLSDKDFYETVLSCPLWEFYRSNSIVEIDSELFDRCSALYSAKYSDDAIFEDTLARQCCIELMRIGRATRKYFPSQYDSISIEFGDRTFTINFPLIMLPWD